MRLFLTTDCDILVAILNNCDVSVAILNNCYKNMAILNKIIKIYLFCYNFKAIINNWPSNVMKTKISMIFSYKLF